MQIRKQLAMGKSATQATNSVAGSGQGLKTSAKKVPAAPSPKGKGAPGPQFCKKMGKC